MKWMRPGALCLAIALPLTLAACGSDDDSSASDRGQQGVQTPAGAKGDAGEQEEAAATWTLAADGPGACFALVGEHLGVDTKVNEIDSSFSAGEEIKPQLVNPEDTPPAGQLTHCSVKYQDPNDDKKLVQARLDLKTGTFSEPEPLEITVIGDASTFNLEDFLVPLAQVDPAPLATALAEQQAGLDEVYSTHAWSSVRLTAPDTFSPDHLLRVDVTGRVAANDVVDNGYIEFSVDGAKVVKENL